MPSKMLLGIEQKGKVIDELRQKLEELYNVSDDSSLTFSHSNRPTCLIPIY